VSWIDLPTAEDLERTVQMQNECDSVDGIIVQLPLPPFVQCPTILPRKDVDGLMLDTDHTPCTALGAHHLITEYMSVRNRHVVIAGRSKLVGTPLAKMMLEDGAMVSQIHSSTPEWAAKEMIDRCDIFVSAVGKPKFWDLTDSMCRMAFDIGITIVDGRVIGDIDFDTYSGRFYSMNPGSSGPMTVSYLMWNTFKAWTRNIKD
jgi:methylenetetrahydrofolate dehydrogenase (NADP+)/methenyltetrahydrofolate cyclohydrolase